MSYSAVWLDHQEAKVFHFHPEKTVKEDYKKSREDHTPEQYFEKVSKMLKADTHTLVMGPGTTKKQFAHYVEQNKSLKDLAKKIVGVENSDHPTDNQIQDFAHKYFKKMDIFTNP